MELTKASIQMFEKLGTETKNFNGSGVMTKSRRRMGGKLAFTTPSIATVGLSSSLSSVLQTLMVSCFNRAKGRLKQIVIVLWLSERNHQEKTKPNNLKSTILT